MNTQNSHHTLHIGLFTAVVLANGAATVRSADTPALKEVYKDHFRVGTAVNRAIVTGTSSRRSPELLSKDIEQVPAL